MMCVQLFAYHCIRNAAAGVRTRGADAQTQTHTDPNTPQTPHPKLSPRCRGKSASAAADSDDLFSDLLAQ